MRALLLFVFSVLMSVGNATASEPALIYEDQAVKIRVLQKECSHPVLTIILGTMTDAKPKAAHVQFRGQELSACAAPIADESAMVIVDEAGTGGKIPLARFQPDPGI